MHDPTARMLELQRADVRVQVRQERLVQTLVARRQLARQQRRVRAALARTAWQPILARD